MRRLFGLCRGTPTAGEGEFRPRPGQGSDHRSFRSTEERSGTEVGAAPAWRHPTATKGRTAPASSKPETRLYGAAGRSWRWRSLGGEARIAWEKDIQGSRQATVAADRKLFVARRKAASTVWRRRWREIIPPTFASGIQGSRADKVRGSWIRRGEVRIRPRGGTFGGGSWSGTLKQAELHVVRWSDAKRSALAVVANAGLARQSRRNFSKPFGFLFPPCLAISLFRKTPAVGFSPGHAAKPFQTLRPTAGRSAWTCPGSGSGEAPVGKANATACRPLRQGAAGLGAWALIPATRPHAFIRTAGPGAAGGALVRRRAGPAQWKATPNRVVVNGGGCFWLKGTRAPQRFAVDVYTGGSSAQPGPSQQQATALARWATHLCDQRRALQGPRLGNRKSAEDFSPTTPRGNRRPGPAGRRDVIIISAR
jgi:hypothetical protein